MQDSPDTALLPTDPESQAHANAEGQPGEGDEGNGSTSSASDEETETGENSKKVKASKPARKPGPGQDLSDDELVRRTAALLFASPEPLSVARLVELLQRPEPARVEAALEALESRFETAGLPMQVRAIRGGLSLMTTPDVAETLTALVRGNSIERVSPAALETLAVIAYRQPVTKADVEAIRGVQAGPVLRSLVDRGLVKVVGRADVPGHPLQYGTTEEFLDRFGLQALEDLPRDSELARD